MNSRKLRIRKQIQDFKKSVYLYPFLKIKEDQSNIQHLQIQFIPDPDSIYQGQKFFINFTYSQQYPYKPPKVKFIKNIPVHPNVYQNGQICLDILNDQWSPALTFRTAILSIVGLINSQIKKSKNYNKQNFSKDFQMLSKNVLLLKNTNIWDYNAQYDKKQFKKNQINIISKQNQMNEAQYKLDQRIIIDTHNYHPFSSIVKIESSFQNGSIIGTGFFIKKDFVLTCAHNVYLNGQISSDIMITALLKKETFGLNFEVQRVQIPMQYQIEQKQKKSNWDFAVLKIKNVSNQQISQCGIIDFGELQQQNSVIQVMISGFPSQYNKKKVDKKGLRMSQFAQIGLAKIQKDQFLSYKITSQKGQSGSPILQEVGHNIYKVIGIHLKKNDKQKFNKGLKLTKNIIRKIQKMIQKNTNFIQASIQSNENIKTWDLKSSDILRIIFYPIFLILQKQKSYNFVNLLDIQEWNSNSFQNRFQLTNFFNCLSNQINTKFSYSFSNSTQFKKCSNIEIYIYKLFKEYNIQIKIDYIPDLLITIFYKDTKKNQQQVQVLFDTYQLSIEKYQNRQKNKNLNKKQFQNFSLTKNIYNLLIQYYFKHLFKQKSLKTSKLFVQFLNQNQQLKQKSCQIDSNYFHYVNHLYKFITVLYQQIKSFFNSYLCEFEIYSQIQKMFGVNLKIQIPQTLEKKKSYQQFIQIIKQVIQNQNFDQTTKKYLQFLTFTESINYLKIAWKQFLYKTNLIYINKINNYERIKLEEKKYKLIFYIWLNQKQQVIKISPSYNFSQLIEHEIIKQINKTENPPQNITYYSDFIFKYYFQKIHQFQLIPMLQQPIKQPIKQQIQQQIKKPTRQKIKQLISNLFK